MRDHLPVPDGIVRQMRLACAHLPEAVEEHPGWSLRWRIRGNTLAVVDTVVPPDGDVPRTFLTFHSRGEEHDALLAMGPPFGPGWGGGLVAMELWEEDGATDWVEVKELVTESYCLLAPKKLVAKLTTTR